MRPISKALAKAMILAMDNQTKNGWGYVDLDPINPDQPVKVDVSIVHKPGYHPPGTMPEETTFGEIHADVITGKLELCGKCFAEGDY